MAWNEKVIKTLSKKEFVDMHQHMKDECDLEEEYDKIVPPKKGETPAKKLSK